MFTGKSGKGSILPSKVKLINSALVPVDEADKARLLQRDNSK